MRPFDDKGGLFPNKAGLFVNKAGLFVNKRLLFDNLSLAIELLKDCTCQTLGLNISIVEKSNLSRYPCYNSP